MSAFVVHPSVIDRIITHTLNETDRNDGRFWRLRILENAGYDGRSTEGLKHLARNLHAMNVAAVSQRYTDSPMDDLPGAGIVYDPRFVPVQGDLAARCQYYMDLRCLIYQCSEGEVPEWPLYKALEQIANSVASEIVHSLPEYDRARWDWDGSPPRNCPKCGDIFESHELMRRHFTATHVWVSA